MTSTRHRILTVKDNDDLPYASLFSGMPVVFDLQFFPYNLRY
jgi:hypothetical protein